ncbi:two component transcriptional regulator, LytTR family [Eubacterium ruminantium]|uniref:Stage 0 sporulation protein A homolog n=1 Tax=Eubacterium ruminantium TaxID=42322 RepID=A0A1T4PUE9_9FIRM|nr:MULTISPECIES: LytTR family DNA-binding domain-containing protein [Eubacterium]MCR5368970.1 LytTR family DNA-binding domain-containing protein [Eubacterium sp.]SCW62476.1 two component transcriptional regulator, LytTR family [Eubacterium ruminantium]SDN14824.1 two component transcriptional regulator, LytTR family [Eubacterium ruminantium]SJZ94901.1 two component transcriptional regulator, LytTR family [Eubacterium ruminantium]
MGKLNVAVCDDNRSYRREIIAECEKIREKCNVRFEISEFDNVKVLKENLKGIDILLLDIELGEDSGIEVKDYIEENRLDIIIIFISGFRSYVMKSFGLNVMGFIDKSEIAELLPRYLDKAISRRMEDIGYIDDINLRSIRYIQSNGVYVNLCTDDGNKILYRDSMNNMMKRLEQYDFCRAHRFYIINLRYVTKIESSPEGKHHVFLGKEKFKISESYYSTFRKKFSEYGRKRAGYI